MFQQGSQQVCSRKCYMQDFPLVLNTQNSRHFNAFTPSLILKKNPRDLCSPWVSHLLSLIYRKAQTTYGLTPKPWIIMGVIFDAQLSSVPFRHERKLFIQHCICWLNNAHDLQTSVYEFSTLRQFICSLNKHFISVFFPWLSPLSKRKSTWSCWDQMRGLTQAWCPPTLLALRARWWAGIQNSRNKYRYKFLL